MGWLANGCTLSRIQLFGGKAFEFNSAAHSKHASQNTRTTMEHFRTEAPQAAAATPSLLSLLLEAST